MAARDLHGAPPNTSQLEAFDGDVDAALADQKQLSDDELVKLNEKVAKEQEKAKKEQEDARDERIKNSDGFVVGDSLKTKNHTAAHFQK